MRYKVISISDYQEKMPRMATLQFEMDKDSELNVTLFPHTQDKKGRYIVSAVVLDKGFIYATGETLLLQELSNKPLTQWTRNDTIEWYM